MSTPEPQVQDVKLDDVSVTIIDGKVYSLQAVDMPVSTFLQEVKQYYQSSVDRFKDSIASEEYDKQTKEWNTQYDHIRRVSQQSIAVIPPNLYNKLVVFFDNSICECRMIKYKPNKITGDAYGIRQCTQRVVNGVATYKEGYKKVWEAVKDLSADKRVFVDIEQSRIVVDTVFCYSEKRNCIYTPFMAGYHTMSGKNLCTGNTPAKIFWEDEHFKQNVNVINKFSLATDAVNGIYWNEFLKDSYVLQAGEERLWTT